PAAQLPLPGTPGGPCKTMSFELPREVVEKVEQKEGGLEAWFFTAFAILIRRLSRQEPMTLDVAVSGRTEPELLNNLGLYEMPARIVPVCDGAQSFLAAVTGNLDRLKKGRENPYETFEGADRSKGIAYAFRRQSVSGNVG